MLNQTSNNNSRIAKNTLFLYFRMIFLLVISLFTSRVVLQTLGVEDYGIYNVVGGVVSMFAFLNSAMAGATQRFMNFDLAKNDGEALKITFSTALIIHFIIAGVIVILSETIGLWFMYEKMIIPNTRMNAAMWVFQCSILVMFVNIISVPYNAAIIAHEKMGAFAYISLLEAALKLIIVYLLYVSPIDKLVSYTIMLLAVSIAIRFVYSSYSNKHFTETKFNWIWNVEKIKEMGTFASWSLIGNLALMGVTQGLNMLLNVFFGPVVNAARGIAVQVQGAVQQFANNFQTAINPQITKSYASNDLDYMHTLVCRAAKFSFLMVFLLSLPVLIMTDQILELWLKTPPMYAAGFIKIMLIITMVDSLSTPLNTAIHASGKIRLYQLVNGSFMLLVLPIGYIALLFKTDPNMVFYSQLLMTMIALFLKLFFAKQQVRIPFKVYLRNVLCPIILVSIVSFVLQYNIYAILEYNIFTFVAFGFLSLVLTLIAIYCLGMDAKERCLINMKVRNVIKKVNV
ncbi:hypothetical protein CFT61_11745 [Segatella copri]|uniref:Lipopolysaccharide biosynthesis protein n=1 Tax=Segatella copri TaxID=165179 RepID=A0AA91YWI3_9BACT|nr:hypothetical protein CFT61_11745 [Segatella copri]